MGDRASGVINTGGGRAKSHSSFWPYEKPWVVGAWHVNLQLVPKMSSDFNELSTETLHTDKPNQDSNETLKSPSVLEC